MLFSLSASVPAVRSDFADVARAYSQAGARRRECVELSNEDFEGGKRGLLKKATHGAHGAA